MKDAKPKILVVDDDADLLLAIKSAFRKMHCTVLLATNGAEALNLVESERPALVISDVRMPKMSGIELLDALNSRGFETPVMIMSGFMDYSAEEIDKRNGVVLLEKSTHITQLRAIVEEYLSCLPSAA